MIGFERISSRTLWVKFKFSRVKVYILEVYGATEGEDEEMERFRNDLNRVLDRVGNGCKLWVLGDLNDWVADRLRAGITGGFGVPGKNDN